MPKSNKGRRPSPTKHPSNACQITSPEKQQEVRDQIFQSVQEMFDGRVEPEVVYLVLTELDWKEEEAIDSLFSLCGETIDPDAKRNKLAEIASQVFGILESPDKPTSKFDTADFPPLGIMTEVKPTSDLTTNSETMKVETNKGNNSRPQSIDYRKVAASKGSNSKTNNGNGKLYSNHANTGSNSDARKISPVIENQYISNRAEGSSDNLRSQLENIKTKHMKSSNSGNKTSLYGSWLSANGMGGQEVSPRPTVLRETSLSPDRAPHQQTTHIASERSRSRTKIVASPNPMDSIDDDLDIRKVTSSIVQMPSVIGGEMVAKKREKGRGKINEDLFKVGKSKIRSPSHDDSLSDDSELETPPFKGHNPLSQSILSGTLNFSQDEKTPVSSERKMSGDSDEEFRNKKSSVWPEMPLDKSSAEIDDDISEETFPEQKSSSSSFGGTGEILSTNSTEHGFSTFNQWSKNKSFSSSVFPSAYGLKSADKNTFDNVVTTTTGLDNFNTVKNKDTDDCLNSVDSDNLDFNINDLINDGSAVSEDISDSDLFGSGKGSVNYSPNVWSPSRSTTETDSSKNLTLSLKKLLNVGESNKTSDTLQNRDSSEMEKLESSETESSVDANTKTYATSAFSLEEIRAQAAFNLSVDAPVFVPRFPTKEALEVPRQALLPGPKKESVPQFMTPKCPVRTPQAPQNFMPKVIVHNIPQYRMPPLSYPPPVVQHPIALLPPGNPNRGPVPIPVNPLLISAASHIPSKTLVMSATSNNAQGGTQLSYSSATNKVPAGTQLSYSSATNKVPAGTQLSYSSAAKKASTKVPQKQSTKSEAIKIDQYALDINLSLQDGNRYLILMRGVPGSGKTTLTRKIKGDGEIFSTDDYFMVGGEYLYEKSVLPEAHEWNKSRVENAILNGVNPVIVDNTHIQSWEMKPYVIFAMKHDYEVKFVEPNTKWRYNANECARRSAHKVPLDTIKSMLDRFEKNVTVESILKKRKHKANSNVNNFESENKKTETDDKSSPVEEENEIEDVDWSEDKGDFFMKDYNICEETVDKLNAETFGLTDDGKDETRQETSSVGSSNSALNEIEWQKVDDEKIETPVTSGKSTPKPLQPLSQITTNRMDNLSKRKFLVSPSLSVQGLNVSKPAEDIKINASKITEQESGNRTSTSKVVGGNTISSEVEEMVDSLILEHVGENVNSKTDCSRILEELKVCLHLMPIESDQHPAVEKLIEQKLKLRMSYISPGHGNLDMNENDIDTSADKGKCSSDNDSSVNSLTPDGRMCHDDEQVVAKFGEEQFHYSDDIHDKEIDLITSNLQKQLFSKVGVNSAKTSEAKCESKAGESKIKLSNVIDDIERHLNDLGISPSPTDPSTQFYETKFEHSHESAVENMENSSETNFVSDQNDLADTVHVATEDSEMLSAEMRYWNKLQAENAKSERSREEPVKSMCKQAVENRVTDIETLDKINNVDLVSTQSDWFNKDNLSAVAWSSNTTSTINSSGDIAQGSSLTPLSEAEAKYWGILTNNAHSVENSEKNENENPKPRRVKQSKRNGSVDAECSRGNNSSGDYSIKDIDNIELSEVDFSKVEENVTPEFLENNVLENDKAKSVNETVNSILDSSSKNFQIEQLGNIENKGLKPDSREHSPPDNASCESIGASPNEDISSQEVKNELNASGLGSDTSSTKKKKKSSKRKLAANFNVPFLDDSFKSEIKQNWNFPVLESPPRETMTKDDSTTDVLVKETSDTATQIVDEDMRVLNIINSSGRDVREFPDILYRIIFPRDHVLSRQNSEASDTLSPKSEENPETTLLDRSTSARLIDRSTSTEEVLESGIEFLENCFPSIREEELSQILEQCNFNVHWAIDLMLEWKYHLYLSPDDKNKFKDAMFKVHHVQKETILPSPMMLSPESLFDTCMKFIELSGISSKENLEKQIIQSGYSRLNSIEDKIRLRMNSFTADSEIYVEEDEFSESVLQELLSDVSLENAFDRSDGTKNHSSIQTLGEQDILVENTPRQHENDVSEERTVISNGLDNQLLNEGENLFKPVPALSSSSIDLNTSPPPGQHVPGAESISPDMIARSPDGLILTLKLPREFAQALLSLFGPVGSYSPGSIDDIEVPIDYRTARALHSCWSSNYHPNVVHKERQLKKDEAYAMKLQLEEDYAALVRQEKDQSSHVTSVLPYEPAVLSTTVNAGVYGTLVKPKAVSLKDIMSEEKERELQKQRHLKSLHASGRMTALSTKLKQQKLYERFPGIDEKVLDDIYEANSCNLEATVEAVRGSLASSTGHPGTVMTAEAAEAYEMKLLNAAEQQSLQEMMDSYLYRPKMKSKTFQSESETFNADDYRGEANIYYRLRHECFQKAQEAFSRGMKQVAVFYSEQGHQHTRKIKESNRKAADNILEHRNQQLQENSTLDLHGLHVDEAILALERILSQREIEIQTFPDKKKEHLIIITGRGSHSRGGISKLRPAVTAFLNRNKYNNRMDTAVTVKT